MVSRVSVCVVLRDSMSISPDCKAVNLACAVNTLPLTLEASPNMAAATARHMSTSRPVHSPLLSNTEKPGMPAKPHCKKPFFLTASNVTPACAPEAAHSKVAATAVVRNLRMENAPGEGVENAWDKRGKAETVRTGAADRRPGPGGGTQVRMGKGSGPGTGAV
ncbi:hypothetical protein D3C86_1142910 [compost metagenome]